MANRNFSRRHIVGSLGAMSLTGLASCAAPSKRMRATRTDADVIVIGAGLAGLHAAYLLEKAGQKVLLVEGNDRTGGRLHTLDKLPGTPDAGGIQVGASYRRFNAIADRLKVERYLPDQGIGGYLYNIHGAAMRAEDWPGHAKNMLSQAEKNIAPASLLFAKLRGLPKLANVADWMSADSAAINMPLGQWLRMNGTSDEAIRLINTNLNGYTLSSMSALHMQRTLAMYGAAAKADPGPTKFVRGGSQRMTDAMTSQLKCDIMMKAPVDAIREDASHVEILLADGRKLRASQAICTVPLSVLRDMKIDTALPVGARAAISKLPYTKASFVFLRATDPFWLSDGLPEYIWSDDPMLGRVFTLNGNVPLLKVWTNGPAAEALDMMDQKEAAARIIAKIEAIRPSAHGKLSYLSSFSWQKQSFARGIYHHIGVGTGGPLAELVRHEGKRLHFAGEHMTQLSPGMEGALESAERVSARILAQL